MTVSEQDDAQLQQTRNSDICHRTTHWHRSSIGQTKTDKLARLTHVSMHAGAFPATTTPKWICGFQKGWMLENMRIGPRALQGGPRGLGRRRVVSGRGHVAGRRGCPPQTDMLSNEFGHLGTETRTGAPPSLAPRRVKTMRMWTSCLMSRRAPPSGRATGTFPG